jgi:hypothetical protein
MMATLKLKSAVYLNICTYLHDECVTVPAYCLKVNICVVTRFDQVTEIVEHEKPNMSNIWANKSPS